MKLNYNQFLAIVYADIFDCPLKKKEMRLWAVGNSSYLGHLSDLKTKDGFYFLPEREKIVLWRERREETAKQKQKIAAEVCSLLTKIPTVQAVFLTGSVAAGNAKAGADVDLMIVTFPNSLWLTRFLVFAVLKSLKLLRSPKNKTDKICPNIFLDTNHLRITEQNLYLAHEVLQVKCFFDRGGAERKWLEENKWTAGYLPNAYKMNYELCIKNYGHKKKHNTYFIIHNSLFLLELIAFLVQYLYMKNRITSERVGWGYAFFHPKNLSEKVVGEFEKRLRSRHSGVPPRRDDRIF